MRFNTDFHISLIEFARAPRRSDLPGRMRLIFPGETSEKSLLRVLTTTLSFLIFRGELQRLLPGLHVHVQGL